MCMVFWFSGASKAVMKWIVYYMCLHLVDGGTVSDIPGAKWNTTSCSNVRKIYMFELQPREEGEVSTVVAVSLPQ